MASAYDESDFVDEEFEGSGPDPLADSAPGSARPPSTEELSEMVNVTQSKLEELKRDRNNLEQERLKLEELRRRQGEFETGREEVLRHLTRGLGLLEEAEFSARKEADQMQKTIGELKDSLTKVEGIDETEWTKEKWNVEVTRALTAIENARMEWNQAKLQWDLLSERAEEIEEDDSENKPFKPLTEPQTFSQLCRVGFALTWPVFVAGLTISILLLMLWLKN